MLLCQMEEIGDPSGDPSGAEAFLEVLPTPTGKPLLEGEMLDNELPQSSGPAAIHGHIRTQFSDHSLHG